MIQNLLHFKSIVLILFRVCNVTYNFAASGDGGFSHPLTK